MSSVSNESVIRMLKNVFEECDKWENKPYALPETKDVVEKGRFALRQLYVNLEQYRQSLTLSQYDSFKSLDVLQNQFKFLVLEQIVKLLFKGNINNAQKISVPTAVKTSKTQAELPANEMEGKSNCQFITWCSFCCFLPWLACAVLTVIELPEGRVRDAVLTLSTFFGLLSLVTIGVTFCIRKENLQRNQLSQQYRNRFFEQLDRPHTTLNADEKSVTPEQKTSAPSSDDENLEIKIDALDITNAELRTPLLFKK